MSVRIFPSVQAYTYQYTRIFRHTALLAMLFFVFRLCQDFSWMGVENAAGSAVLSILLLPLFIYFRQLTTSYVLEADRLLVRRRVGKDRSYAFSDLRRAIIQQTDSIGWHDSYELRLVLPDEETVLPITYLHDREQFVRRLQLRIEGASKRLLYQDKTGEFLPSLQELARQEA